MNILFILFLVIFIASIFMIGLMPVLIGIVNAGQSILGFIFETRIGLLLVVGIIIYLIWKEV